MRIVRRLNATDLEIFGPSRNSSHPICGIGIDRGKVLAGPVGSREQFKYGIIGHAVNVSARLESLTRPDKLAAPILISADIRETLTDFQIRTRRVGHVQLPRMKKTLDVYEYIDAGESGGAKLTDGQIDAWHLILTKLEGARTIRDLDELEQALNGLASTDPRLPWLRRTILNLRQADRLSDWDGVIRVESS